MAQIKVTVVDGDVHLLDGTAITQNDFERMADAVATSTPDVAAIAARATRGPGRPALGSGPSVVLQVRLDVNTRDALRVRAAEQQSTPSAVAREAIRRFLDAS